MAQMAKMIKLVIWSSLIASLAVQGKSLPLEGSITENRGNGDELSLNVTEAFKVPDVPQQNNPPFIVASLKATDPVQPADEPTSNAAAANTGVNATEAAHDGLSQGEVAAPAGNNTSASNVADSDTPAADAPKPPVTTPPKKHELLLVESLNEPPPCGPHLCDVESTLVVTLEPAGNDTGFVSRALGLPVHFECALYTQGRRVPLPVEWLMPNGSEVVSSSFDISSVQVHDNGAYVCKLRPTDCCPHVQLSAKVELFVYELSETAGIILMLSVLASIVVLVGVFCYSQKKKKYHTWLKHEILAAASSSSSDSTPRSTLRRDLNTNSKKYLLNS